MTSAPTPDNPPPENLTLEIFGWIGAILIVSAYALSSLSVLLPTSVIYQLMNLVGAIGILATSVKKRNFQPVLVNGFWLIVASVGIFKIITAN